MCNTSRDVTRIGSEDSQYDQDSYWGRVRHHFQRTNPIYMFTSSNRLEESRCLYLKYRCGAPLPVDITDEEIWKAKRVYESAYHHETGEKLSFLARPSSFIPINMILAGGMMAYYNSTPGIAFWHWLNQTYNTYVSYETRGSEEDITTKQLVTSYVAATGTAIGTALGLNRMLINSPTLLRRFVPFVAVAAAHCVGTPLLKAQ